MEKTTVYLPTTLSEQLRARAAREGRTQAEIVRESVARYLADTDPLDGFAGAFDGPADGLGGQALDDWMHATWAAMLEGEITDPGSGARQGPR